MAHSVESKKARRRRLTLTVSVRRKKDHQRRRHGGDITSAVTLNCTCAVSDTYFSKRGALACGCRKRRKGCPRVDVGMCNVGDRERIYEWRTEVRELRAAVRAGRPETD